MMVVDVDTSDEFSQGEPRELFSDAELIDAILAIDNDGVFAYDVSPDGSRFLMLSPVAASAAAAAAETQLNIVLNWPEELALLAPFN